MLRIATRVLIIVLLAPGAPALLADEAVIVPRGYLDSIADDISDPLPRSMTPAERLLPMPRPERLPMAPPTGDVRTPAEYERNQGLLISWGWPNDLLTAMTVGITTGDPSAVVYIAVSGPAQEASATSILVGGGADMDQVEFIHYTTDSVWMRDYGPRFIHEDGQRAMVDHTYNRQRPADNAFPDHLSTLWSEAQYDLPLTHGGGNFHLLANGQAFMTDLILDPEENPGLTEAQVKAYFADYEGLDLTIFPGFPTSFDGTQHIDMWMLPVAADEVIIGQYVPGDGTPYTITEDATTELISRGYTVHRTPGWNDGWAHFTYTNSVVFNDLVFLCQFDTAATVYETEDQAATAVFQSAFPSSQIIPVDCSDIIYGAGAIHCIVMHVPEPPQLFSDGFESGDTSAWGE